MSKPLWKKFLLGFLGLNAIAVTTIYLSDSMLSISSHRGLNQEDYIPDNSEYRFIDPELAYGVLSQLETISDQDPNSGFGTGVKNYKPYLSIQTEDDYCDKRRAFFVESPESLFKEMTFLSDLAHRTFVRSKVLSVIGNDTQSHIALPLPDLPLHRISPAISNFYTRMSLFRDKNITRHFACISQSSNQIPGEQALDTKYLLANAVVNYAKQFEDRPQCFSFNKFFPKTYRLYDEEECNTFFEIFNSPAYQAEKEEKKIVYIKKIGKGAHMGSGVFLVNDEEEASLRQVYANGAKCGKVKDVNLVQNYIHKPMLIYGRKFDFRAYVFIASTNPLIAYYHDGSLRISLMDYDIASNDKKTLLTNIKLNHEIYANASQGVLYKGMDEEQLRSAQQWSFEMFQNYLLETGQVKDLAWFDDYLRPQFKKAMIHMLRFGLVSPFVNSAVYQHYGIDFMLDEDLNLWFIEANSAPGMDKLSKPVENFLTKLLTDEMEIVMGLLRSRMKRVINYVNYLIMDGSVTRDTEGKVVIKNLEAAKLMFNKLTQNYFEEEFEPSPSNGFQKIIDGNYKGADKYLGFVSEECI